MKKFLCVLLACVALFSHAATDDELLAALTDLNENLSYIKGVVKNSTTLDNGFRDVLPSDYLLGFFSMNDEYFYFRDVRGNSKTGYSFYWYYTHIRDRLITIGDNTAATTNELVKANEVLVEINDKISSNRLELAEIAASLAELKTVVPVVEQLSGDISDILTAVTTCNSYMWSLADYARKIFDLMSVHYDLVENQLRQIYEKMGDLNADFTNTMSLLIGEGISINGTVQIAVPHSPIPVVINDLQFPEFPDYSYLYDWYQHNTYHNDFYYDRFYVPFSQINGDIGRVYYWEWNGNAPAPPGKLDFMLQRQQNNTRQEHYYNGNYFVALMNALEDVKLVSAANNSVLSFIAAKLCETNSYDGSMPDAETASASGESFNREFDIDSADVSNPIPDWNVGSLPSVVSFGTVYLPMGHSIVFNVETSTFASLFSLIRTGFQLTYFGLVLAFFWFAFRVLRWVCPYIAAIVHWLLQFN